MAQERTVLVKSWAASNSKAHVPVAGLIGTRMMALVLEQSEGERTLKWPYDLLALGYIDFRRGQRLQVEAVLFGRLCTENS